jgi:hypothetical protein
MRHLIIAFVFLTSFTASSFADSERAYVSAGGGFAVGPDGTSGDVLSEVGAHIAPHLSLFGNFGRFHNLQPSVLQPLVDVTSQELAQSSGLDVVGTPQVPAWYSLGGLRVEGPTRGRFSPYVQGGAGLARLTPRALFSYSSGPLPDQTPVPGQDVTSALITLGDFTQPSPTNAFMYSLGTGTELRLDRHMTFDVGYRFSHVAAEEPLHVQSVTFGMGYRF